MSMPPDSGKYTYCAASHADGRSIPAHRQRRQPKTRNLPAIGWSAVAENLKPPARKAFRMGSDYVIQIKDNQPNMHQYAQNLFSSTPFFSTKPWTMTMGDSKYVK